MQRLRNTAWNNRHALMAVLLPAVFQILYFRSYAPITEGWWHVYAAWISQGRIPYLDFELLVPPLYPGLLAGMSFFGISSFLALRIFGIFLHMGIGLVVFQISRPFIGGAPLSLLVASGMIYLQMGTAFINYDYVYVAILFTLLTFLPMARLVSAKEPTTPARASRWIAISGIFAGLAFFTKQTNGLVSIVLGALLVLAISRKLQIKLSFKSWVKTAVLATSSFILGLAAVLIVLLAILVPLGAWNAFISQVLFSAPETKGGLAEALTSWAVPFGTTTSFVVALEKLFQISVSAYLLKRLIGFLASRFDHWLVLSGVNASLNAVALLAAALIGYFYSWTDHVHNYLQSLNFLPVILVIFFAIAMTLSRQINTSQLPALFAAFALIWASGMSAGLAETAMFLTLILTPAILLSGIGSRKVALAVSMFLLSFTFSLGLAHKLQVPFNWWELQSGPVNGDQLKITEGLQGGLFTSPSEHEVISSVNSELEKLQSCAGEIVAFPHVPLFILNQQKEPEGKLAQYWFDFSSRTEVIVEQERLLKQDIKALIIVKVPEHVWSNHERLFTSHQPLAQRQLLETLNERAESLPNTKSWDFSNGYKLSLSTKLCSPLRSK